MYSFHLCWISLISLRTLWKWFLHSLFSLIQGSPTSKIYCLMIWWGVDVIIIGIKFTVNVMCLNQPETLTPTPGSWKNQLPQNQSLVPKTLGNTALIQVANIWGIHSFKTSVFFVLKIARLRIHISELMPYLCS